MLEGTDGRVYYKQRAREMEELRSQRGVQTNSLIRLRKFSMVRGAVVEIKDMGDSESRLAQQNVPAIRLGTVDLLDLFFSLL